MIKTKNIKYLNQRPRRAVKRVDRMLFGAHTQPCALLVSQSLQAQDFTSKLLMANADTLSCNYFLGVFVFSPPFVVPIFVALVSTI